MHRVYFEFTDWAVASFRNSEANENDIWMESIWKLLTGLAFYADIVNVESE